MTHPGPIHKTAPQIQMIIILSSNQSCPQGLQTLKSATFRLKGRSFGKICFLTWLARTILNIDYLRVNFNSAESFLNVSHSRVVTKKRNYTKLTLNAAANLLLNSWSINIHKFCTAMVGLVCLTLCALILFIYLLMH